jgi:hypothetical protein
MEFLFTIFHSKAVSGVDNPDESVGLFKVVSPVRTERALPTNIPCILLNNALTPVSITTHRYSKYNWKC